MSRADFCVGVRIRPLSQREKDQGCQSIISVGQDSTISITNLKVPEGNTGDSRERIKRFKYDFCFGEHSTQSQVFDTVRNVVSGTLGDVSRHSCILAYGQSSTGKTYTMLGRSDQDDRAGLIYRFSHWVFHTEHSKAEEMMKISYLEIYNEKICDLLDGKRAHLKLREHPQKGAYVQDLTQCSVSSAAALQELIRSGDGNRRKNATGTNPESSRSHAVLTLTSANGRKLTLVDLAGSERGQQVSVICRTEGSSINKSLVALGNVISTLAEGKTKKYIPYRDSCLTWLLRDIFQDNPQIIIINTISPANCCYSETINTLRFGQRAKQIVRVPIVKVKTAKMPHHEQNVIRELRLEIARLRHLISTRQQRQKAKSTQTHCATGLDVKMSKLNVIPDEWLRTEPIRDDSSLKPIASVRYLVESESIQVILPPSIQFACVTQRPSNFMDISASAQCINVEDYCTNQQMVILAPELFVSAVRLMPLTIKNPYTVKVKDSCRKLEEVLERVQRRCELRNRKRIYLHSFQLKPLTPSEQLVQLIGLRQQIVANHCF